MKKDFENNQKGFLDIIIGIIIALVIMKLLGITVSDVISWFKLFLDWFKSIFSDVLR